MKGHDTSGEREEPCGTQGGVRVGEVVQDTSTKAVRRGPGRPNRSMRGWGREGGDPDVPGMYSFPIAEKQISANSAV